MIGFLAGGIFLRLVDRVLPHLHGGHPMSDAEGIHTSWRRSVLLVSAITLHNIPEELVSEAKRGSPDIAAMSVMVGFAVMMTLDVALG
ncbi:MAG TPA: hypothetical protein VK276_07905 [Rubrobacteraceae bacterium]|nr:hypothetical protein [Rubrobacteraceae bacterium]